MVKEYPDSARIRESDTEKKKSILEGYWLGKERKEKQGSVP